MNRIEEMIEAVNKILVGLPIKKGDAPVSAKEFFILADGYKVLLTALAEKDDEINHHLLVLGESAKSEAEKDKRIEELIDALAALEVLVSRGRAQIAVMGGAGDRLTSENAELREKWHSFSKATLGEWAELKKERDTLKEEVAELREKVKGLEALNADIESYIPNYRKHCAEAQVRARAAEAERDTLKDAMVEIASVPCICEPCYKDRGLIQPDCFYCHVGIIATDALKERGDE